MRAHLHLVADDWNSKLISAGYKLVTLFNLATLHRYAKTSEDKEQSYFETLKTPNIHHVIAALGNHTHHLHSFLQYNMRVTQT